MQQVTDELLAHFFNGLCTKEEAALVLEFIKAHPDHPYLLGEWENADNKTPLPAHYTLEMYDAVVAHISKEERRRSRVKLFARIAVAACTVSVFIFLWKQTIDSQPAAVAIQKEHAPRIEWVERLNTRDTAIRQVLRDGSAITLSPRAHIRYQNNFGEAPVRAIYLQGEAVFEVAKNKAKPFIVYSNYISTTALGTIFRVTAGASTDEIKVRLQEGKVVVAITDTGLRKRYSDYYLTPGQELVFSRKDKPGTVHNFVKHTAAKVAGKMERAQASFSEESYMFNNQTLADVLDQLAAIYKVKITYSKEEIGQMYFIGRIEKNDPVDKIISDIALLNKLSVKKQVGGFTLKRKRH
ncbi:MAG: FecR family protein [Chitinophagaceae bacterium]